MCLTFFSCWEICFSHILHLSIILSSIVSYFITLMHLYGFLMPPLIILDHLYVFWVKLSSFLYPLSLMTKMGRNCGEYVVFFFFFKILHVRGRNAFLCKGEMCFILLESVLTSLFLYTGLVTIYRHTLYLFSFLWCWCIFLSPTLSYVVSYLSLYTCFLLFVCNLLFLFHTKMPWWVLFKVFQKYRLSKSICHKLSSCKIFQEFVLE